MSVRSPPPLSLDYARRGPLPVSPSLEDLALPMASAVIQVRCVPFYLLLF